MLVTGEIKCLHCGFISGRWVGPSGSPFTIAGFTPASGVAPAGEGKSDPAALVHCARCTGSVYLDDVDRVISSSRLRRIRRMRQQIAVIETYRSRAA